MQCEKCRSDNTQRLEVVFEQGTSLVDTTSRATKGDVGTVVTSGVSQTLLGEKASPPEKKSYKFGIASIVVSLFFLGGSDPSWLWGGGFLALGVYLVYNAFTHNNSEWPGLYRHWQESWLCHKCGNIFHSA